MIDQLIVGIYLALSLIIGLLVGRNTKNIKDFAVGKRNFPTVILLATLFATVIDGGGTVGLAETVYSLGPIYCLTFLGIAIGYLGLAFFIAPKFDPYFGLVSCGDILGQMYGSNAKIFMGLATVFEGVLLSGIQILAMTHLINYFFPISPAVTALGSALIIVLYSLRGGMRSVTASDMFQFLMLIVALPVICGYALTRIGGFDGLLWALKDSAPRHEEIDYLKHIALFATFSIPAIFPRTLQRMLMAKNTQQIKTTFIINGLLCIPFYLIIGAIAISALVLLPNIEANSVFPGLISEILPIGVKGFVIAGLLAVLMSSIDSDLNIAAISVTHDIVEPLSQKNLGEAAKLKIARIASALVALMAIACALYFNSIFGMIYFVLCISNSAFMPGYLLGFLGFKPTSKGFWTGLIAASCSVMFFTFVVGLFEIYTGLISIALNILILLAFHWKERPALDLVNHGLQTIGQPKQVPVQASLSTLIERPRYCGIVSTCLLINCIFPFFLLSNSVEAQNSTYLFLYLMGAILAFLVLFREVWEQKAQSLFTVIWFSSLIIPLSCLTTLMCLHTQFHFIWAIDLVLVCALLITLTDKKGLILTLSVGALGALIFYKLTFAQTPIYGHTLLIGYWSLIWHIVTLIWCLVHFRNQDIKTYRFLSGNLAHEAGRSLSSFAANAQILNEQLPKIFDWCKAQPTASSLPVSLTELDYLSTLPSRLQEMSYVSKNNVNSLLTSMKIGRDDTENKLCSIEECLYSALNNPSICKESIARIKVKCINNFNFFGNSSQITHVLINLI